MKSKIGWLTLLHDKAFGESAYYIHVRVVDHYKHHDLVFTQEEFDAMQARGMRSKVPEEIPAGRAPFVLGTVIGVLLCVIIAAMTLAIVKVAWDTVPDEKRQELTNGIPAGATNAGFDFIEEPLRGYDFVELDRDNRKLVPVVTLPFSSDMPPLDWRSRIQYPPLPNAEHEYQRRQLLLEVQGINDKLR